MQLDVRLIGGQVAGLAGVAVRAFAGTMLVLTLAGVALAGLSYYFLREYPWWYGVVAVVVALAESLAAGFVLGGKRAVVLAAADGLGKLRLGRSLVRQVFDRMLGIAADEAPGERGGQIARKLERIPLAQLEEKLSAAVRSLTGEAAPAGWLRQKFQSGLLEAVRKYTLARFREEGAQHGGVDLLKVKAELEETVDDLLVQKVRSGLRLWTWLVLIGLPLLVAGQTWAVIQFMHSQG